MNPEEHARQEIDRLLAAAGWAVQGVKRADLTAARGVALREFELNPGHGTADYLLYVDGKAAGIFEAKKQGATLTGVEVQSGKYAQSLPASLPAHRRPLPFLYESTGQETHAGTLREEWGRGDCYRRGRPAPPAALSCAASRFAVGTA